MESLEIIALSISSALATACGIGGGAVYSSFFFGIQEFEPSEAFPISNCIILLCGIVTFINRILDKFENPKNKFVNYDIVILFGPCMVMGTKIGTILNVVLNKLLLTIFLFVILLNSIFKNIRNIRKAKEKEEKYENELKLQERRGLSEPLLSKSHKKLSFNELIQNFDRGIVLTQEEKELLKEEQMALQPRKILFMLGIEILLIFDQFIEGNKNLSSLVGITRCSISYWIVFSLYLVISFILIIVGYRMAKSHLELTKRITFGNTGLKEEKLSSSVYSMIFYAILAGIISPMIGIGGGMIINPIFAGLGLDPKESSATSNFLIITTVISSTILFICSGQLNLTFTLILSVPCVICAFLGSVFILGYINRTKKSSFLLVMMAYIMVFSLLVLITKAYLDWNTIHFLDILTVNPYC